MLTLSRGHGEGRKEFEIDCRSHVFANGQINQEQCELAVWYRIESDWRKWSENMGLRGARLY